MRGNGRSPGNCTGSVESDEPDSIYFVGLRCKHSNLIHRKSSSRRQSVV